MLVIAMTVGLFKLPNSSPGLARKHATNEIASIRLPSADKAPTTQRAQL